VVPKKKTFAKNGQDEAPTTFRARTARHDSAASLKEAAKQMPSVRLTFKEGEARTVRFLHEPYGKTAWVEYYEHYVPGSGGGNGAYVPCIDGCKLDGDIRASRRWFVNVWDRDSKQVRLLKLTGRMVENLMIKFERRGTMLDRDYSITRTGSSTDTEYHIEAEEKERFDTKNIKLIDIQAFLDQQAQSYYGGAKTIKAKASSIDDDEDEDDVEDIEDEDDEDEEEAPTKKKVASKKRPVAADEDEDEEDESDEEEDEEDEDEDEDEEPVRTKVKAGRAKKAVVVEEDEDEDEDDDEEDEDENEEEEAPRRKTTKTASRPTATTKRPLGKRR
jgi:hypothetical protein